MLVQKSLWKALPSAAVMLMSEYAPWCSVSHLKRLAAEATGYRKNKKQLPFGIAFSGRDQYILCAIHIDCLGSLKEKHSEDGWGRLFFTSEDMKAPCCQNASQFDANSFSAFILMPVSLCESSFHKRLKVLYAFNQHSRCDDVTVLCTNSGALGMFWC